MGCQRAGKTPGGAEGSPQPKERLASTQKGGAPTSVGAVAQVNPRLVQRLEAFRAYKANGGTMDMARWVGHTKANPNWGNVPKSGYADWIRSVNSLHGNSKLSSRPAFLYRLEDADGNLLKWESRKTSRHAIRNHICWVSCPSKSAVENVPTYFVGKEIWSKPFRVR
jgi:hypothetical protein